MRTIAESKITSKHQLTLPRPICRLLGVSAGDSVVWRLDESGRIVIEPGRQYSLTEIREAIAATGASPDRAQPVTVEAMKEGLIKSIRSKHARD